MKKLLLILLLLPAFAFSQQWYKAATIVQLKAYNGSAGYAFVSDSNAIYTTCSPCTADEYRIFAGTRSQKWKEIGRVPGNTFDSTYLKERIDSIVANSAFKNIDNHFTTDQTITGSINLEGENAYLYVSKEDGGASGFYAESGDSYIGFDAQGSSTGDYAYLYMGGNNPSKIESVPQLKFNINSGDRLFLNTDGTVRIPNLANASARYVKASTDGTLNGQTTIPQADVTNLQDSLTDVRSDLVTSVNTKQAQLNGTGFVKATGTTITYDNSVYTTITKLTDSLKVIRDSITDLYKRFPRRVLVNNQPLSETAGAAVEQEIYRDTIRAGSFGLNSKLAIDLLIATTAITVNSKLTTLKINGTAVLTVLFDATTEISARYNYWLINRGSLTSQISGGTAQNAANVGWSTGSGFIQARTFDTSADLIVTVTQTVANAGEALFLHSIEANIFY